MPSGIYRRRTQPRQHPARRFIALATRGLSTSTRTAAQTAHILVENTCTAAQAAAISVTDQTRTAAETASISTPDLTRTASQSGHVLTELTCTAGQTAAISIELTRTAAQSAAVSTELTRTAAQTAHISVADETRTAAQTAHISTPGITPPPLNARLTIAEQTSGRIEVACAIDATLTVESCFTATMEVLP